MKPSKAKPPIVYPTKDKKLVLEYFSNATSNVSSQEKEIKGNFGLAVVEARKLNSQTIYGKWKISIKNKV